MMNYSHVSNTLAIISTATYNNLPWSSTMELIRQLERTASAISDVYSPLLLWFEVPIHMRVLWMGLHLGSGKLLSYLIADTPMVLLIQVR